MNYILIIYLIGVAISIYININILREQYNEGNPITIGDLFKTMIICLLSWGFPLVLLLCYLLHGIIVISEKQVFKKYK